MLFNLALFTTRASFQAVDAEHMLLFFVYLWDRAEKLMKGTVVLCVWICSRLSTSAMVSIVEQFFRLQ